MFFKVPRKEGEHTSNVKCAEKYLSWFRNNFWCVCFVSAFTFRFLGFGDTVRLWRFVFVCIFAFFWPTHFYGQKKTRTILLQLSRLSFKKVLDQTKSIVFLARCFYIKYCSIMEIYFLTENLIGNLRNATCNSL